MDVSIYVENKYKSGMESFSAKKLFADRDNIYRSHENYLRAQLARLEKYVQIINSGDDEATLNKMYEAKGRITTAGREVEKV